MNRSIARVRCFALALGMPGFVFSSTVANAKSDWSPTVVEPVSWNGFGLAGDLEQARAAAIKAKARCAALEKEATALLADNNRLQAQLQQSIPMTIGKGDVTSETTMSAVVRSARQQYTQLQVQYQQAGEQLTATQAANRKQSEELIRMRSDLAQERARANAAEQMLATRSGQSAHNSDEVGVERQKAVEAKLRAIKAEQELAQLRKEKSSLETLVTRLDPDRVARLESALKERDELLRDAAAKLGAQGIHK